MRRDGADRSSSEGGWPARRALAGWAVALGAAVVLTAVSWLLWGDLSLRVTASPALVVGEILAAALLVALAVAVGRRRREAALRRVRLQVQEEARTQHR